MFVRLFSGLFSILPSKRSPLERVVTACPPVPSVTKPFDPPLTALTIVSTGPRLIQLIPQSCFELVLCPCSFSCFHGCCVDDERLV